MKKVIITGAGGFVGSALTKKMIDNGIGVIAISLKFIDSFPESPLVTRIESGIDSTDDLLALIPDDNYEAFYHLAWMGVNGPEKADPCVQAKNIMMTMACAAAAHQTGCKKFLCSGTVAERAVESLPDLKKTNGSMLYGAAKCGARLLLESYCKNVGLEYAWMQFSNIYGSENKTGNLVSYTLNELKAGREALFGPASQPYDFIYIDDLIEAVFRLGFCETKNNFYFIGSGSPRILRYYLTEIGEIYGKPQLIRIGERDDDGIVYSMNMFDTSALEKDIGDYHSGSFTEKIKLTIEKY